VCLKNVHHVPSINKNLVSGYLLHQDGYKIVLESKVRTLVGKGCKCEGLFRLCLSDVCKLIMFATIVYQMVWYSRLCHINVGCMMWLAKMNLISEFTIVKGSK
jgi:hypothetical protein